MGLDPDVFKKMKPIAELKLDKIFHNIESNNDVKIPMGFLKLVNDKFEKMYPENEKDLITIIIDTHDSLKSILEHLQLNGNKLDSQCVDFVDSLIVQLYKVTKGKGIGDDLWTHFPKIWNVYQVVISLDNINLEEYSFEFALEQVLNPYVRLYELTTHNLIEITRKIAERKRKYDTHSKKFYKIYRKRKKQGQTVFKGELIRYFNTQSFLDGWKCNIGGDAYIRNKVAHSDYYYDEEAKRLVFGKKFYEFEEFKNSIEDLYSFNCYLLFKCMQEEGFIKLLDDLLKLKDAFNNVSQKEVS